MCRYGWLCAGVGGQGVGCVGIARDAPCRWWAGSPSYELMMTGRLRLREPP